MGSPHVDSSSQTIHIEVTRFASLKGAPRSRFRQSPSKHFSDSEHCANRPIQRLCAQLWIIVEKPLFLYLYVAAVLLPVGDITSNAHKEMLTPAANLLTSSTMAPLLVRVPTLLCLVILVLTTPPCTSLWVPHVLSSNMILPRFPRSARLWGTAEPLSVVAIYVDETHYSVNVTESGGWLVKLNPMSAVLTPFNVTINGDGRELLLKNVRVGDVFLCSGQSNMLMSVLDSNGSDAAIAASDRYEHMALYQVDLSFSSVPQNDTTTWESRNHGDTHGWQMASSRPGSQLAYFSRFVLRHWTEGVREFAWNCTDRSLTLCLWQCVRGDLDEFGEQHPMRSRSFR